MDHYSWVGGPREQTAGWHLVAGVRPASDNLADTRPAPPRAGGGPPFATLEALSQREREVLRYVPSVLSAAEIGAELYVSVNTVKAHLRSIYRKLGVNRRRDAVIQAHRHGLL
jgi:LuxR family transcriptional regulator, maltose regulon positive regulatory protein